ncbi:MAG: response regulator, partial [bacterium]|nr:response regulator [bacterium]
MSNNSGRILVVDDQGVSRMLLCHYLDEAGFEACSSASCEDALYQINSSSFDLVLLDIIMPGMNGMELLRILRSRFNMLELPIIMVSSLSEPDDKVHALENGANDFILKPVEPQEAIAKIRIHLNMHYNYSQLKENLERCGACLHGADVGIWDWNLKQDTIYYSPRFIKIIEPDEEKLIEPRPQEWFDRIHPDDRESVLTVLKEHLDGKTRYFLSQHRIQYSDGSSRWVYARGTANRREDGKPLRITGAIVDVNQSMTYDNVTGLITKRIFCDVMEKALAKSLRSENKLFALLTIEINKYSELEEQLGSMEMSKMIASISRRLQLSSRASDTIALLKPWEFGIILEDLGDASDALRVARRITESVSGPMLIADQLFNITCSIGIALSCSECDTPETMLGFAEQAMQAAKAIGDNQSIIHDSKLHAISNKRLSLENSFNEALSQQKFFLLFRPIINTNTGAVCGTESHIRWKYGDEILTPRDFFDIIEQSSSLG